MPRNLVFCSDGTGNSAASTTKTNVWRVYDALDRTGLDQLASFDDGVGTSWFRPMQLLGLALGTGTKRNVLDLYKFLCRNYEDGDQLYGFGFSRGAFTIRIVAGLVSRYGLVRFESEEQLDRDALAVYRHFRANAFPQPPVAKVVRWLTSPIRKVVLPRCMRTEYEATDANGVVTKAPIDIRFLGLWDTVGAYGLPIDELTIAVDKWIWPMRFDSCDLPERVRSARQALSLDDERRTFFPIPWEDPEPRPARGADIGERRLVQAWFAGVHANVGGGYPDDRLALVPLNWIMQAAADRGLRFNPYKWAEYKAEASMDGAIYDSRATFGAFYRYQPRSLARLMPRDKHRGVPLLHESVIHRMAGGSDHYAPISIDVDFDVLEDTNTVIAFEPVPGAQRAVDGAIATLYQDSADQVAVPNRSACVERVRDLVWWGRALYFAMLASALAAISIAFWPVPSGGGWAIANAAVADVLTPIWGLSELVLPAAALGLIAGFRGNAIAAIVIVTVLVLTYLHAGTVRVRIHDWSAARWNRRLRQDTVKIDKERKCRQVRDWGRATCGLLGLTGVAAAGWQVARNYHKVDLLPGLAACAILLAVATVVSGVVYILLASDEDHEGADGMPYWALLALARGFRNSWDFCYCYRWLATTGGPIAGILAALGVAYVCLLQPVGQQLWFQSQVVLGVLCQTEDAPPRIPPERGSITADRLFDVSNRCWSSGLWLEKGVSYEITLTVPQDQDWFDRSIRTDVEGFPTSSVIHFATFLSKRWLGQNWFKPIARIGSAGATEFPLDPFCPLAPARALDRHAQLKVDDLVEAAMRGKDGSASLPDDTAREITAIHRNAGLARRVLVSRIHAPKDGPLFLYVNDAWPQPFVDTYANNAGTATVSVRRLPDSVPLTQAAGWCRVPDR